MNEVISSLETKIKTHKEQLELLMLSMETMQKKLVKDFSEGKKDPLTASSILQLQYNIQYNKGAVDVLLALHKEFKL